MALVSRPSAPRSRRSRLRGFSLVEVIVVITVIGVVSAIALTVITNVRRSAQVETADANLEHLNQAVLRYNHALSEITNAVGEGAIVFSNLQVRNTNDPIPGSPFLESNLVFRSSSATNTIRAVWNGRMFEARGLGTNGTGLDLERLQGP